MSFASSLSAFGLKPSTTSNTTTGAFGQPSAQTNTFGSSPAPATNAFSAFGQNQQQNKPAFGQPATSAAPSVFGQTQQPAAAAPSVFGQPQQQQQQATPSPFGQTNTNTQQQPNTSVFGQSAQPQQQQSSVFGGGSSTFGQPNQQQQQPAGTPSLFGQPSQPAAGASSIFGQPSQPASGTQPLFGQSTNQNQQQPSTGAFGQSAGTGIFGNSAFGQPAQNQNQQQQQAPNAPLFGNSTFQNQQPGGGFGSNLFNKPQQAPAAQAPLFHKSTKFNDLNDQIRKQFEDIEAHIQGRIQISKGLSQRKLGEEPTKSQEQLRSFHKELVDTVSFIRADSHHTKDLKVKTEQAVEDTITAMRIIDAHKSQQMNHPHLKDHASFPFEFFSRLSREMHDRLVWCKSVIEQIERKLASMAQQSQYTPHGISATLQAQHSLFLALASKTAVLDAELQKIKGLYTQLWRTKTGSVRDPFNELDTDRNVGNGKNSDLGLSSLSVR